MARSKGSKNRPKHVIEAERAAKAARSSAPPAVGSQPGHNSDLTEAEKKSRLVIGLVEIEKLEKEKDGVVAKIRNERKRLGSFGFTKVEVDFALGLRKEKDEESVDRWNALRRIAAFLNHPIGTQPDMIGEVAQKSTVERAAGDGHRTGLEGGACKPPSDSASPEGQSWIEAWHRGVADRNTAHSAALNGDAVAGTDAFDDSLEDAPPTGGADADEDGETAEAASVDA